MPNDKKKQTQPRPKPWYLGFGLARFAAEALDKGKKEREKKLADLKKE